MISILIPVFNRDVNSLVQDLSKQVSLLHEEAEIIVMDDGSEPSYRNLHLKLHTLPFVRYLEPGQHNGRIRIRQLLAGLAGYEWLLFLDCDSKIVSDQFIETYYRQLGNASQVMVGGRIYSAESPIDCNLALHWKYGTLREKTIPGLQGYHNSFMTNNFLIHQTVFKRFDFNGQWEGYGYEDTWMGIQLEDMAIPIKYVDNPVLHDGLETSVVMLAKSRQALQNLKKLSSMVPEQILVKHVRLFFFFYRLRAWRMLWISRLVYFILASAISKNLHSCNPSLFMFDLYRLHYFAKLQKHSR